MSKATGNEAEHDWTHILVETASLDDVKGILRGSTRLRFTSIDVSSKYLVLGSNTGSVYVFGRTNHKHPQIIVPEVDPAQVNNISISPVGKSIAFSTVKGHVLVYEVTDRRQKPERLRLITDHVQTSVNSIIWDTTGGKLYTGDSNGRIFVTSVPASKVQNLVALPPEVILRLESPVCQVDFSEDKLLVSTLHKCYLCYTTKQKFTNIGSKPRDGEYGACFLRKSSSGLYKIYCARPGSRIWEVDIEGTVLNTHMFKEMLAVPAMPLVSSIDYSWQTPSDSGVGAKSLAFPRLKTTREDFLFTWVKSNLYILDPVNVKVIFWTDLGSEILNIVTSDNYLFIIFLNGNIQKTRIYPIPQCVSFLISKKSWQLAQTLVSYFQKSILKMRWRKYLSVTDLEKFREQNKNSGNDALQEYIISLIDSYSSIQESESELDDSFSDRSRSSSSASTQLDVNRIDNDLSILSPEIRPIPDDFKSSPAHTKNPELDDKKLEILDLIDSTSKDLKVQPPAQCMYQAVDTVKEYSLVGEGREHLESQISNIENNSMSKESVHSTNHDLDGKSNVESINEERKGIGVLAERGLISDVNIVHDKMNGDVNNFAGKDFEENPHCSDDIFADEDLKPVVSLQSAKIAPLVVTTSKKRKKSRKQSVNDIVFEGTCEGTQIKGMRRSKSMSSISKSSEKKLTSRQSFEEPLVEEVLSQTVDVSNEGVLDLVADSKSLGGESVDSASPSSSLGYSWESTGSEKLAEFRKKSKNKLDSVQSTITNTKNKLLNAIKTKARPREGKITPDTLSLDSVDGVIISAEKVQKEIVELAPVVQGPIDLTDLQKSTERTRMLLQDINILMNPAELQKTLSDWVKDLNQSLCRLHTFMYVERLKKFHTCKDGKNSTTDTSDLHCTAIENVNNSGVSSSKVNPESNQDQIVIGDRTTSISIPEFTSSKKEVKHLEKFINVENLDFRSVCHLTDPFLLEQNFKVLISELTQMCFDCGCHGNIVKYQCPSLTYLEGTEVCDKCKEVLNKEKLEKFYEKGTTYDLRQRDSGYNDNCDKKKGSEGQVQETLQGFNKVEKEQKVLDVQTNLRIVEDFDLSKDSSMTKNQNSEIYDSVIEQNRVIDDNMCSMSHDSGISEQDDSQNDVNKNNVIEQTGYSINGTVEQDISSEELENLSGPQSCTNSDGSFPSITVEDIKHDVEPSELSENTASSLIEQNSLEIDETAKKDPFCNEQKSCLCCHLSHVTCYHGNSSEENHNNLTLFVQKYYFLLNIDNMKTKAYSSDENSYQIWCGLVKCIQDCCKDDVIYTKMDQEVSATAELLRLGEFQQSKILGYLSRLFEIKPDKASMLCIEGSTARPEDVLYFCKMYCLPLEKYFYQFMKAKVTNNGRHDYYQNTIVVEKWLEILLKATDMSEKVFDERQNPRSCSHLVKWEDEGLINSAIHTLDISLTESFCHLCKDVGYWHGHLTLLKRLQRYREMLVIINYLQDLRLLDSNRTDGILPSSLEEWKWFIDQFNEINQQKKLDMNTSIHSEVITPNSGDDGDASNNNDQASNYVALWEPDKSSAEVAFITWDAIGQLMIQNLGPVTTVQIIEDYGKTGIMFSPAFFQSCVLSSFLHRQQRNITHSLLEKLDSYLWTKKPVTLMPELQFVVSSEKEGYKDDKHDSHDSIMYVTLDQGVVNRQYREDMEVHWGTSTRINRSCRNCNIKLTETVSHVEPGIIVFPCGHGFHKFCCPLRECILCADVK